jgi:hypothetical protein
MSGIRIHSETDKLLFSGGHFSVSRACAWPCPIRRSKERKEAFAAEVNIGINVKVLI